MIGQGLARGPVFACCKAGPCNKVVYAVKKALIIIAAFVLVGIAVFGSVVVLNPQDASFLGV